MNQTTITMRVSLNGTVTGKLAEYDFTATVHDEPSIHGIYQGRVCRLSVSKGPAVLFQYDHGWHRPIPESCRDVYNRLVKALEELPA